MEHSLQAKWSLWEGVLLERTHAYQDISTHLQASFAPDTKDFEVDPVCQSSEGGGEKATSFWGKY